MVTSVILNGQFDWKKSAQATTDSLEVLLTLSKKLNKLNRKWEKILKTVFNEYLELNYIARCSRCSSGGERLTEKHKGTVRSLLKKIVLGNSNERLWISSINHQLQQYSSFHKWCNQHQYRNLVKTNNKPLTERQSKQKWYQSFNWVI